MFETVVERCLAEGLVGGEGFAVDASLIAADANKQRSIPSKDWRPRRSANAVRAVREYLATLDDAAFGAASEVTPKFISRSDPAAQWTGAHKGHAFFAYAANYLIDTDHAVILDVEASRAIRQAEVGASRTMLDRTETRFGLKPDLAADSAYGSAANLAWLVKEREIAPHIPVFDKSARTDGTFSRADFVFDAERNHYTCPRARSWCSSAHLHHSAPRRHGGRDAALSRKQVGLRGLRLQSAVLSERAARKIPRDLDEDARDVARAWPQRRPTWRPSRRRKKVEMLFAHLKRILGSGACGCAVRTAPATNSYSRPPLRI